MITQIIAVVLGYCFGFGFGYDFLGIWSREIKSTYTLGRITFFLCPLHLDLERIEFVWLMSLGGFGMDSLETFISP